MSDSTSGGDHGSDLDRVRQGLQMATPLDPAQLEAEKDLLRELEHAPVGKRYFGYLKFIGPGYMQSAMTLGSGTAASSLFAGAVFGYDLLWVAPLGMLLGILVMGVVSHQTLSTGQRMLPAMSTHAGKWVAFGFAMAAMLASIVWHFAQYNLAASVLVDATETIGIGGVPPIAGSAVVLVWAIMLSMSYGKSPRLVRVYEGVLKYTVWGIVLLLGWVVLQTDTDWGGIASGFVPNIPEESNGINPIEVIVATIAAAVGINMLLLYPYSLQARGWGREHRGLAKFDLFAGMLIPYVLASALMVIAAANTLHASGVEVGKGTAIPTLARVLGDVIGPVSGRLLFDFGMLAMALTTITLHMVCCGFVGMEWFGLPFGSKKQRLCMLLPIPGALAPVLFSAYPLWLSMPTTIISGAMMPIAYVGFLILQRKKAYMGADRPTGLRGIAATGILVVSMLVLLTGLTFYLIDKLS